MRGPPLLTAAHIIAQRANELNGLALQKLYSPSNQPSRTTQDITAALAFLTRAIFLNPKEPSFFFNRAEAYILVNDFESAIANFRKGIEFLPPRVRKASVAGSEIWHGTSTDEDEDREVQDLFYSTDKFEAIATSSAWLNLRLRRVYYTFGQILLDQRRLHESLRFFKLARDLGMHPASVYLRMVAIYIGLNQTDAALELLYNLIDKDPQNADLYILRAKLYSELGSSDLVSMDLRRVVQIRPDHPEVQQLMEYVIWMSIKYKNKAAKEILKGQFDVAIFFLNHALELDPYDWITLLKRGVVFSEMGHYDSAIGDFTSVLEREDRDPARDAEVKEYISSVYNKLGIDHYLNGNYAVAIQSFNKGLEYSATEPTIHKNLADTYFRLNDDINREMALNQALSLDLSDDESRKNLASLYFKRGTRAVVAGEYPLAINELTRAIKLETTAGYFFERGRTYMLMEELDGARADLARVIEMDPKHRDAHAMLDQLTVGIPYEPFLPFPPQKVVVKGPFETTGEPRTRKKGKLSLIVPTTRYLKPAM
ncbi:hypothetical protein BC830DRAFT_1129837 [Chytriomyces sp. MP71]|nr:hypothetical protein BC830DRAFT_1129837 [Chytriomyces sp. MP71]